MAFVAPLIPVISSFIGSIGGVGTILSAGSTVLGAATAIQSGNYASAVAKNNASIAERNAVAGSRAAQEEARRSDIESAAETAALYAQQAVSGIDTGSRSSIAVRSLSARTGRLAAGDISKEGSAAAQRLKQDAMNFRAEAKQAKTQGYLSAAGTLLKGGEKIFGIGEASGGSTGRTPTAPSSSRRKGK